MVYVLLAEGFEEIEALCPVDILRRGGVEVSTVSIGKTTAVKGAHNIVVEADTTIARVLRDPGLADHIEALVLPGGMPGASNLDESEDVEKLLAVASITESCIGAICAAPMILGKRGMLAGKRAVCYPSFEEKLLGAEVTYEEVAEAGNVITSRGMGTAIPFALRLTAYLTSEQKAEELKKGIIYQQ